MAVPLAAMSVQADTGPWRLATADTILDLAVASDHPVIRGLRDTTTGHNWAGDGMAVPLIDAVEIDGRRTDLHWRLVGPIRSGRARTLTLEFSSPAPQLTLRSIWRARPGRGPVEHWLEIVNLSKQRVTLLHQDSLSLVGLRPGGDAKVWWIRRGAANASVQGGVYEEPVTAKLALALPSNCEDGASPVPWASIQVADQRGVFVGWEFSGLGRVAVTSGDGSSVDVSVGNHTDFRTDVRPGETFVVPPAFVGCYAGDVDDGSYSLHRFVIEKLRPRTPPGYPDPSLNYAIYLDGGGPTRCGEAELLRVARFAHGLGFEVFMPDAMWFPECGDWRWDPARFPSGITPIEEYVHTSGMRQGVWCGWTNGGVSSDPNALSVRGPVAHPDWFRAPVDAAWQPGPFYGAQLCLASDAARRWAIAKTQWLVDTQKLDYLKHDCGPIVTSCVQTNHRHGYGVDVSYWATMGYYDVQQRLRKAFPRIVLENCSGAGHIKDFGVIQRTHYTASTDTLSNLPDRQSVCDSTYALPPIILQVYTYDRLYNARGDDPGPFLWRSAMMCAWQLAPFESAAWTDVEQASVRRAVHVYRTWIRPMFRDVQVHHVLPRPDGIRWDGLFYWSARLRRGMLFAFRPDSPDDRQTIRLKGLDRSKSYWVWAEDGSFTAGQRTGAELMDAGLTLLLPAPYTSDLIYVRDAALGKPRGLAAPGPFRLRPGKTTTGTFAASAALTWEPSSNAISYRLLVSASPSMSDPFIDMTANAPSVTVRKMPPGDAYWRVEARGWGGTTLSSDGPGRVLAPSAKGLPGVVFASDLPWAAATIGVSGTVRRDETYQCKDIRIAGKHYPKGIWTHAFPDATPADVVIELPDQRFGSFSADVGLEDAANGGSVVFQVLVDGKVQAESPIVKAGQTHRLRVALPAARTVTLRVLNGGDGYSCDHAAWGMARFVEVGTTDPFGE